MANKKINIFTYDDFRRFLADYFERRRNQMRAFSIRHFARRTGIASHSFISAVIKGKRNLTPESRRKIACGLELEPNELRYFDLLVDFNQAKRPDEKQDLFEQLNVLRRNTSYYKLNKAHFKYMTKWYYFVIRELAVSASWNDDFGLLASLVMPQITESEARSAIKLLLELGILIRLEDDGYCQAEKVLSTSDLPGHLVRQARKQFIELAGRASDDIRPDLRNMGSTTLTLSRRSFEKAAEIMEEARRRIVALADDAEPVHRVYQAHLHLFPVSKELDQKEAV